MAKSKTAFGRRVANIHNNFFYAVFKDIANIIALMQAGCPKALFDIIDWSTLKLMSTVISADEFHPKIVDLAYCAKLKGSDRLAQVVLLFEHKSFKDKGLEKQMARYQFLRYMEDDFSSLIIPIVVRQDASDRREMIDFSNLFSAISKPNLEVIMDYAVSFRCVLIDLLDLDREGRVAQTRIDIAVRAMSIVRDFDTSRWWELLERIRYVPKKNRNRMFQLVFGYICSYNKDIGTQEILSLETETAEEKQMVMSAVEAFREEGRVEGLEKGRKEVAANLLLEGMETYRVAKLTELSRKQVESLRKKLNGSSDQ